jgi:hypothetical protein
MDRLQDGSKPSDREGRFLTQKRLGSHAKDSTSGGGVDSRFEAYCHERWGIGRFYAYLLIATAEVTKLLTIVNKCRTRSQSPAAHG